MKVVLLALLICALNLFAAPKPKTDNSTIDSLRIEQQKLQHQVDSLAAALCTMTTMDERGKQMVEESKDVVEQAIKINDNGVKWVQVLLSLFTIFIAIAGVIGWSDRVKGEKAREELRELQKSLEAKVTEIDLLAKRLRAKGKAADRDAKSIQQGAIKIASIQKEVIAIRKDFQFTPISETPSPEMKAKLDELNSRLNMLEQLGGDLSAEDWKSRGDALFYKEQYVHAIDAYDKSLLLDQSDALVWFNRGYAFDELNLNDEALASYERSLALEPNNIFTLNNKGVLLSKVKRYEEAVAAYDKALSLTQNDAEIWVNKGGALAKLGRNIESLAAHEKAIELNPDDAVAWDGKGCTLHYLGRYNEALAAYEKAIELKSDYANAWINRAGWYALKGDKTKAIENLKHTIALDSQYKEKAKTDEDFKSLWDDEDFKKLVG